MKVYYLDTCIWLNLFKKEGDASKGVPYWEIAEDFIKDVLLSEDKRIIYSKTVIRELQILLDDKTFLEGRNYIEKRPKFIKIPLLKEDENNARRLESYYDFEISFYDLIHISISKRLNAVLVTRDKDLIEIADEIVVVIKRPEEL